VTLTIAVDGAGFEAPDVLDELTGVGSFGLAGMRERARLAGGDLSIESEPGEGCVVSVWIPAGEPARQRETREPPPLPPLPLPPEAPASGSVRDGAVEGFTWQ
jgi:signal transduction histidine kinase